MSASTKTIEQILEYTKVFCSNLRIETKQMSELTTLLSTVVLYFMHLF